MISRGSLINIFNTDLDVAKYLYNVTSTLLFSFFIQANEYAALTSQERIANIIIEFTEEFGEKNEDKIKINFKISQQFISNLVGVKILTTARILKKFKDENILEYGEGYYYITDMNKIKKYASNC